MHPMLPCAKRMTVAPFSCCWSASFAPLHPHAFCNSDRLVHVRESPSQKTYKTCKTEKEGGPLPLTLLSQWGGYPPRSPQIDDATPPPQALEIAAAPARGGTPPGVWQWLLRSGVPAPKAVTDAAVPVLPAACRLKRC